MLAASLLLMACGAVAAAQTGARQLFNGKDLSGWQHVGPGSFVVEGGLLRTEGGMGLLWYPAEKFDHTVVRLVFRLAAKDADSGLFIRIPEPPSEPWMPVHRGYEVEIGDWPDDYSCTGVLYTFTKAMARPLKPMGEWNTMEVTLDGPRIVVMLNGVKVTDFREGQAVPPKQPGSIDPERGPRPLTGYLGLQNEPGPHVYYKEISVRPLPSPKP